MSKGGTALSTRGHEGKACDAVVKLLEQSRGHSRADIRYPEKDGNGPPVEVRLKLGSDEYALEHTLIEPFENEIRGGVALELISSPVRELLSSLSSRACYWLVVPGDLQLPRNGDRRQEALRCLVDWIVNSAGAMPPLGRSEFGRGSQVCDAFVRSKLAHFRGEFELQRWPDAAVTPWQPGSVEFVRDCPLDLEEQRRRRLERALSKKRPKLQRCRASGARTVLVLESDDLALTSFTSVGDEVVRISPDCKDGIDEIFMVETATDPWLVWPMRQDQHRWPRVAMRGTPESYGHGLRIGDFGQWNPATFPEGDLLDLSPGVGL